MKCILQVVGAAFLALWLMTCEEFSIDDLDPELVLLSPDSTEALVAGSFLKYWLATENWEPMGLSVAADELTSPWSNAGMKDLNREPREAYDNSLDYKYKDHIEVPWYGLYEAIVSVNDALREINKGVKIGTNGMDTPRAVAFGRFVQGLSYGFLANMFDQAFIADETTNLDAIALGEEEFLLSPYNDVMDAAIGYLEKCITLCGSNTFTTPTSWINELPLTNEELGRVAHSYIARFMAAVSRTPVDRAAVAWTSVKTHAAAGIMEGEDFGPLGDGYVTWISDYRFAAGEDMWFRADYKTIGLTDTSGNYQDWLAFPPEERRWGPVLHTVDRRITGAAPDSTGKYFYFARWTFRGGVFDWSVYAPYRWVAFNETEAEPMITLTFVEMELLRAEAGYWLGNLDVAVEIVNRTRVVNGELPPLTGTEPDFFEWLKYEKKIETFATAPGLALFDRRGWGDLVSGTALHFPVPAKELEILQLPVYTFGGGGDGSAP